MLIRPETPSDNEAVRAVNLSAFPTPAEADLVDALRTAAKPCISLLAELNGQVRGHILFSPVSVEKNSADLFMGLAPMAVHSRHQRAGIGSALVEHGIEACRVAGAKGIVVLGHPEYYPRFGFRPASQFGVRCVYEVPDGVFMAMELVSQAFARGGLVKYHPVFA